MTPVIGIKCKDGIVLVSDSRGTSEEIKTVETKIFNIVNTSIGIGASGYADNIRDFIKKMKIEGEFNSEESLRIKLYLNAHEFQKPSISTNSSEMAVNDINIFSPIKISALVGVRLKNGDYCLYQIQINDPHPPSIIASDKSYESVGSGKNLAYLVLNQQNRINNLGELDINTTIGLALYIIDAVKQIDPLTGGETQIAVIDEKGYREILPSEQPKYYDIMINILSNSIGKNLSNSEKIKETLKRLFPVSRTNLL